MTNRYTELDAARIGIDLMRPVLIAEGRRQALAAAVEFLAENDTPIQTMAAMVRYVEGAQPNAHDQNPTPNQ